MITRAQAEALLTLAESLEACERLDAGVTLNLNGRVFGEGPADDKEYARAVYLRFVLSQLAPKSET